MAFAEPGYDASCDNPESDINNNKREGNGTAGRPRSHLSNQITSEDNYR